VLLYEYSMFHKFSINLKVVKSFLIHSVACTINIATIVNYGARGVIYNHSIVPIVPIL
jgi:hypothetical protein